MYTEYYHLKKQPFNNTPDPEFLYRSPSHEEALSAIAYGVDERKGLIVTIGEVGVGKTTILRSYLESVDRERVTCISLVNSGVSFHDLLTTLIRELGFVIDTDNDYEKMSFLREKLQEAYDQDRRVVLMVDEADKMPVETLASLGSLHNFETDKGKLIQIILAAQPEFDQILIRNELRQVKQRVAIRTEIMPLTQTESLDYITHRLSKAAIDVNDTSIFTKGAIRKIIRNSGGIPRLINILCDNALITGFGYQKNPVDAKVVKEIVADFGAGKRTPTTPWRNVAQYGLLLVAAGIIIFQLMQVVMDRPYKDTRGVSEPARIAAEPEQTANQAATHPAPPVKDAAPQPGEPVPRAKKMDAENNPAPPARQASQALPVGEEPQAPDVAAAVAARPLVTEPLEGIAPDASQTAPAVAAAIDRQEATPAAQGPARASSARQNAAKPENDSSAAVHQAPPTPGDAAPPPSRSALPVRKIVKPGDTLYRLTLETYGGTSRELFQWIQKHNPHIKDITKIKIGDQIIFPQWKESP